MRPPLSEQVIVLTGASSGIGRAAALRLARRGALVVLAARNGDALLGVADEINRSGGRADVIATDVAERAQVNRLADMTLRRHGRLDTWINDAGVSVYGAVEDLQAEEIERVLQVNLLGSIYGCQAALAYMYMRPRGAGRIINIGSAASVRALPLQAPYSASKHGLKGFTDALGMELDYARSGVTITLIVPASINTPFFNHARSRMGVAAKPIPPVYQPDAVADAIVAVAEAARPPRDIFVGLAGQVLGSGEALAPAAVDWLMTQRGLAFKQQMSDKPPPARDNLFEPSAALLAPVGEWGRFAQPTSFFTRLAELPSNQPRLLAGATLVGAALWLRRSH